MPKKVEVKKSKPLPKIAIVAIVFVGILIVISVIFSKFGLNFMKKVDETKTGVEITVGEGKISSGFPKDFPLYPGAKVEGNISGAENQAGKGFWLIMSTTDTSDKVTAFYETNLPKNGWTVGNTMNIGPSSTWEVTKGDTTGTVMVASDDTTKGTSIVITLAPKEKE